MSTFDITGKNALVNGANRGIGRSLVDTFLENGAAKVYAAVRTLASAEPLVAEHGDKVVPVQFDLASADQVKAAAKTASDVHLVVNNAGVLSATGIFDANLYDAMKHEYDINVYGLLRTARAFAPVLKANGGGAFVQLNSVVSLKAFPGYTPYCSSKAAAYSITQVLRAELTEQGTAVFSIHPGPIATDMADNAGLTDIAEPTSLVGDALMEAFRTGSFHVFPDTMAKEFGEAYASFAEAVVEAEIEVEA